MFSRSHDRAATKEDFANLDSESQNSFFGKFQFLSFEDIPECEKHAYKPIEEVEFYHEGVNRGWPVVYLDGRKVMAVMGHEAYNIHPIRWDRVKKYISNGKVAYPEILPSLSPMDGRHRTLALMKIYDINRIPFVCNPEDVEAVRENAAKQGALLL